MDKLFSTGKYYFNEEDYKVLGKIIKKQLEESAKTYQLIDVSDIRGIGKTYALIEFAKENNYAVIVNSFNNFLIEKSNYEYIYQNKSLHSCKLKNVVVDEGVNLEKVKEYGFTIITGFCCNPTNHIKEIEDSQLDKLSLDIFDKELRNLMVKLTQSRGKEDFGTYKNLILAYKEVYRLMNEIKVDSNITPKMKLYFDINRGEDGCNNCVIYFNNEIHKINSSISNMGDYILDLIKDKNVNIYCDGYGMSMAIIDYLKLKNIEVIQLERVIRKRF